MSESREAKKSAPLDLIREKAGIELKQAQRTCWREIPWDPSKRMFDSDRATEASKKFALTLFDQRAEAVLQRQSDYEMFKTELDAVAGNVVVELEQEWKGVTPGNFDQADVAMTMICIPAVRRALANSQETWRLRFLDSQLTNGKKTELSESTKSPLEELRALGLIIPIDEETASKLWVALLRIDADVRKKRPEMPAEPVQAAYQVIAAHVLNGETPDQVLEEMIPQMIFSFASTRPWSRYPKLELLCRVLRPCVIESKADRLEMVTRQRRLDTGQRPQNPTQQPSREGLTLSDRLEHSGNAAPVEKIESAVSATTGETPVPFEPQTFLHERMSPDDPNYKLVKRFGLKSWADGFELRAKGFSGNAKIRDFVDAAVVGLEDGLKVLAELRDDIPLSERCTGIDTLTESAIIVVRSSLSQEQERLGVEPVRRALVEFSDRVRQLAAMAKAQILRGELTKDAAEDGKDSKEPATELPTAAPGNTRRGRRKRFTTDQLQTANQMKKDHKPNNEIAKILYNTLTPTPDQRRSVPTILKHHFGSKK